MRIGESGPCEGPLLGRAVRGDLWKGIGGTLIAGLTRCSQQVIFMRSSPHDSNFYEQPASHAPLTGKLVIQYFTF